MLSGSEEDAPFHATAAAVAATLALACRFVRPLAHTDASAATQALDDTDTCAAAPVTVLSVNTPSASHAAHASLPCSPSLRAIVPHAAVLPIGGLMMRLGSHSCEYSNEPKSVPHGSTSPEELDPGQIQWRRTHAHL